MLGILSALRVYRLALTGLAVLGALAYVPFRLHFCDSSYREVQVGDSWGDARPRLGRWFTSTQQPFRWLSSDEEYACSAWPYPKIWVVGVTGQRISDKEVLVSP